MGEGSVCYAHDALDCKAPVDNMQCSLPATSPDDAGKLLELIGSGGSLGAGAEMWRLGVSMPRIRQEYEALIGELANEVAERQKAGQSSREIAKWVVKERRRIAFRMRLRSGPGAAVLFEVRDWGQYGAGGRTHNNLARRYRSQGYAGDALSERLIVGAQSHNKPVSSTAIKGARYLRYGGRVLVVFSLATTAYVLLTAPEEELERLLYQEVGAVAGGALGSGLAVGGCLVFGVATGGWGLLACGIIGGGLGGWGGSVAGEKIYYSNNPSIEVQGNASGVIEGADLTPYIPAPMCTAPSGH